MIGMDQPLLVVNGVWKRLCRKPEKALQYAVTDMARAICGRSPGRTLRDGEFWALQNVDFDIDPGEVIGVIGHNGAGKSTLINIVSGVILPTLGTVRLHTDRVAIIDHSGGLNPIETGRENAITQLALQGVPDHAIAEEMRALADFAAIGDFIDAPVGTYSLGMRLRLAFSIYTRLKPDLFIIDEAIGGGDLRFRNKFRAFLRSYVDGGGSILLCSHEMGAIQAFCDRCILLDRGRVMMSGPPVMMIDSYQELIRKREIKAAEADAARDAAAGGQSTRPAARCVVESVGICAADGGSVRPGSTVIIEVILAVSEAIPRAGFFLEIGRGENPAIATLVAGYSSATLALSPPRMTLTCRVDHLPLAAGNYELRVAVSLPDSAETLATSGYEDAATVFAVVPLMSEVSNFKRLRENVVHVEGKWHLTPHGGASTVGDEADGPHEIVMHAGDVPAE